MKFSCEKALLQAAISTTSRTVSPKNSIPAPGGILLEAGNDLRLIGYNLEASIRAIVPADIWEEDTLVLNAHLFGRIVRKLPDDVVTSQSEGYMVNIKYGVSEFSILGTDPEESPKLPTVEYQNSLVLPQSRLKAMISQTLFTASDNKSRPIHIGSLFEVGSEGLTTVSVNGYRLALRHESTDKKEGAETFSFVVPGAVLSEVEKTCGDVGEPASVTRGARHVMFKVGDAMPVSRHPKGEFLAYRQAIPRDSAIHVKGDTRALFSSTDRASLTINDKLKSPLRYVFDNSLLKISTKTAIDDAHDRCPLNGGSGGLETGFNNKCLMDALETTPADKVRLELTTDVSPYVILSTEGEGNFLYIVLSMRLKTDE